MLLAQGPQNPKATTVPISIPNLHKPHSFRNTRIDVAAFVRNLVKKAICCEHFMYSRNAGTAVGRGAERVEDNGNLYKTTVVTNCACFWPATMLTSNIVPEIIENHSEFCGCTNSCNKFVSS